MAKIDELVQDHEVRIRTLEVNSAVLAEHVKQILKWASWGIAILGGSFLLQLANLIIKR